MKPRYIRALSVLLFAAMSIFLIAGCSSSSSLEETTESQLKVVTTISPLYSLTANLIEGTDAELVNLVPINSSVHTYQLTPGDLKTLSEADLVVVNGLLLEEFLSDALENTDAMVVDTSEGIDLLKSLDHEDHEDHHHGEYDPHIWLSISNAKIQSQNILKALQSKDSVNAQIYEANYVLLSQRLDQLHKEVSNGLKALNIGNYIVFHDAYQYFERDFDVHSLVALEEFPGKEPSPEYLKEVIELIEEYNVTTVFSEPQFSPKLLQTLAKDYNVRAATLDPLGSELSKDAYFTMLRSNLKSFEEVFSKK